MQRAMKWFLGLLASAAFLCGGFVVLHGSLPPASINAWLPAGSLTAARTGAASVLLQDGRLLITGGNGASGALATTDILNPSSGFTPGPPMNFARSSHVAVLLQDGRVLVAGGTDTSGRASQSAELFDPAANSWSASGPLMVGRSGATATLLPSGQVLIAGGTANGAALASLELFDPNSNTFTSAAGVLSSPRENHAVALLPDGRVLIAGGWDGTTLAPVPPASTGTANVLASTDIFDPSTGAVTPGPALSSPRMNFTATTALDGSVVAIGGTDGQNDLASIDVLAPVAGAFVLSGAQLITARQGHLAFLLPHNGNILVVGGTSGGTAVSAVELYTPWTGATSVTGAMASARSGATGSPLAGTVAATSSTPATDFGLDGALIVAGGQDASSPPVTLQSAEVYGFATIKTDKADYAPGDTVVMSGSGWLPNETVQMSLVEVPDLDGDSPIALTATADASGNFSNVTFPINVADLDVHFTLTAVGGASLAQTTFTDANHPMLTITGAGLGSGTVTSSDSNINCTITAGVTSGTCSHQYAANFSGIILTATPTGVSSFSGWSGSGGCTGTGTCSASETGNNTFTATATFAGSAAKVQVETAANGSGTIVPVQNVPAGTSVTGYAIERDSGNNFIANVAATWSLVSKTGGVVDGDLVPSGDTKSAVFTGHIVGSAQIEASANSFTGDSGTLTVVPGTPYQLVFGQQPTNTVAGATITPAITVKEEDAIGNVVTSDSSTPITIAILNNPASGTLGGTTSQKVVSGIATFNDLSINNVGTAYTLQASHGGLVSATCNPFNITSAIVATTTTVISSQNPSVFGESVTFTAVVSPNSGTNTPTGTIAFVIDGGGSVAGTPATCPVTAPANSLCATTSTSTLTVNGGVAHTITANYTHTGSFSDSNGSLSGGQTVSKADTTTTVGTISPEPSLVGESYSVAYTVVAKSPGSGAPTGTVTVDDGNGNNCSATVAVGSCSLTSTSTGTKTITATYAGDTSFNGSNGTASHVVSKRPTTTTVTSVSPGSVPLGVGTTVTVTVKDTGSGTASNPGGSVNLTSTGSGTFTTCTLAPSGTDSATCTATFTPNGTISGTSRTDTITASFTASDTIHQDSSDATGKVLTVTKRSTSTTVTSLTPNSVVVAQPTTVRVTVVDTESGTVSDPGGTVSLSATGNGNFGTCTLMASGTTGTVICDVSYTPSDALGSPQTIKASFTATDSIHKDSADTTGKPLTVTRRTTSTGVVLTPPSVVTGQPSSVAVTVTDTQAEGTKQYPTGTVTVGSSEATDVFTGTCTLGNTLTMGVSTCSVSVKPIHVGTGSHMITATFLQTDVHLTSNNNATLTVSKADTSITGVTASPEPSVLGSSYLVSWTLSVVSPGSGTPTGTVNVSDGHGNTCSATAPANSCTVTTSTVAGPLTLTVTYLGDSDFNGSSGTGSHTISYGFAGLFDPYAPPGVRGYKVNSAIPLIWDYTNAGGTVVPSSSANPLVQIYPAAGCGDTSTGTVLDIVASGNSGYQYDATTNTWQFNWKTGGPIGAGCYVIYIKSQLTGQTNGPFPIQLVR